MNGQLPDLGLINRYAVSSLRMTDSLHIAESAWTRISAANGRATDTLQGYSETPDHPDMHDVSLRQAPWRDEYPW